MNIDKFRSLRVVAISMIWSSGVSALGQDGGNQVAEESAYVSPEQQSAITSGARIEPEVYARLANSADGTVYVTVALKPEYPTISSAEQRTAQHAEAQADLLSLFETGEFEDSYLSNRALVYGHVSATGLDKLADSSLVRNVRLSKVDPAVHSEIASLGTVRVLVSIKPVPDVQDYAQRIALVSKAHADVFRDLTIDESDIYVVFEEDAGFAAEVRPRVLEELTRDPNVTTIIPDYPVETDLEENLKYLQLMDVANPGEPGEGFGVWIKYLLSGRGVKIAVLDTGFIANEYCTTGLAGAAKIGQEYYYDAATNSLKKGHQPAINDHGTKMASYIGQVAFGSKLLPVRVFDPSTTPSITQAARCVEELTAEKKNHHKNLYIMNMSFGYFEDLQGNAFPLENNCACDTVGGLDAVRLKFQKAKNAGITLFATTGNAGTCDHIKMPACFSAVAAVTAVNGKRHVTADLKLDSASFPGVGHVCNLLAAPGYQLDWCMADGNAQQASGTSPACAITSGLAALLLEFNPKISPASKLLETGRPGLHGCQSTAGIKVAQVLTAKEQSQKVSSCLGHPAGESEWIDWNDGEIFLACMTGVDNELVEGVCGCCDYPASPPDGDVDLLDFAAFQREFTGYPTGACCDPGDGTCSITTYSECVYDLDGTYFGSNTLCETWPCPYGACCQADGSCVDANAIDCAFSDGAYLGDGTRCATDTCPDIRYRNTDTASTVHAPGAGVAMADDIDLSAGGLCGMMHYGIGVLGGGGDVTASLYTDCPGNGGTLIAGTEYTWNNIPDDGAPVFLDANFDIPATLPANNQVWLVVEFSDSSSGWFFAQGAEIGNTDDVFGKDLPPWACNGSFPGNYAGFWANVACVDPAGACCLGNGSCVQVQTPEECTAQGGQYAGSLVNCIADAVDCTGACCLPDTTCTVTNQAYCEDASPSGLNGIYHGYQTVCAPDHGGIDCTMGACCRGDGTCEDMATYESCTGLPPCPPGQTCPQEGFGGAEYMGPGTSCASSACDPPPKGACCFAVGSCLAEQTPLECASADGVYLGESTLCEPGSCEGACCIDELPCEGGKTENECDVDGGNYQGHGTDCNGMDCTAGACCLSTSACYEGTELSCDYEGGLYDGDGTDCTSTFCENCADGGGAARCPAKEFNKLTAITPAVGDHFGHSVAIDGTVAVVGSPLDDDKGTHSGSVYVARGFDNDACIAKVTITAPDAEAKDQFGAAVAIAGNFIVVGAPFDDDNGSSSGSGYVFKYSGSTWEADGPKLAAGDGASGDRFGWSVALSGDGSIAVIGANGHDLPGANVAGSAYVFRRFEDDYQCRTDQNCVYVGLTKCSGGFCDGVAWVQEAKLIASDAAQGAKFGTDVDIDASGMTIVVGAPLAIEVPPSFYSGQAYVFEYEQGDWAEKARLLPQNPMPNNSLPISVSVSDGGEVVLVGAPWADDACDPPSAGCDSGAAYVYNRPLNGWTDTSVEDARITSCDLDEGDHFGRSVSMSADGSMALVGAPNPGNDPEIGGAAYAFRFNGSSWYEEAKFTASDQSYNEFGFSTSLSDDTALIGAPRDDHTGQDSGSAYVFRGVGDCDATGSLDICEILADPSVDYPLAHDCCETGHGPGCNDEEIEDCVCYSGGPNADPYCCETYWDDLCVAHVEDPAFDCNASCGEGNGIPYACEGCPADLFKDGDVGPHDLAYLLAAWGPCPSGCPEDLSGDCEVGAFDLAILLGSWGPCPDPLEAHWNGGPDGSGALRFALGGGGGCLSLEEAVQMLGYNSVGEFIEWVLSAVPPEAVYQVAQFLLWLLDHWPC